MIRNKRIILIVILLILIFSSYSVSENMDEDSISITDKFLQEQLDSLNIRELELVLEDIIRGGEEYYPEINIKEIIVDMIKGKNTFDIKDIASGISILLFKEILSNLVLISEILIITIACSILTNLQSTFERDTVAQLAHYACYIVLSMLVINSFMLALDLGKKQ